MCVCVGRGGGGSKLAFDLLHVTHLLFIHHISSLYILSKKAERFHDLMDNIKGLKVKTYV